jgi:hypothetical protein
LRARALIANALAAPLPGAMSSAHPYFAKTAAFSGLTNPNSIGVASDRRVFIASKSGLIRAFGDSTSPRSKSAPADQHGCRTQIL